MAGVAGSTGRTGATGPQGAIGQTGAQGLGGPGAASGGWKMFRDFTFDGHSDDILRSDLHKSQEIADYLNRNPSALVAIDGPSKRYVHSVVESLTDLGVPISRIQTGTFSDPKSRSDHRVDVLVNNQ